MTPTPLRRLLGHLAGATLLAAGLAALSTPAQAVPSFTRQTGQECATCHIGSFGPQLTPYGMKFKMGGYTESSGNDTKVPLSAMLVATYTGNKKALDEAAKHFSDNNNGALQEASVFLAGKLADNIGSFSQVTYSGIDRKVHMDNFDIRAAGEANIGGQGLTVGLSLNNNPTSQDPFNTLPQWRFPYSSPEDVLANVPAAAPMLAGGLAQKVWGAVGYVALDNGLYAELGGYSNFNRGFLEHTNTIDPNDPGQKLKGLSPYWRLAYMKDLKSQAYSVGLVGMSGKLHDYGSSDGLTDRFNDVGVDASWQYLGTRQHVFALNASYLRETQHLDATFANGGADRAKQTLDEYRLAASYHYAKTYGVSLGYFDIRGSKDSTLWGDGALNGDGSVKGIGSLTSRPNSSGWIAQADWTPFGKEASWGAPWANVRLGLQYTWYDKFNGASRYINGVDDGGNATYRSARDNNTLYGFVWTAF